MKTIIGLEIHVELNTKAKIFCGCSTEFGSEQNSQCCPICLGMPGTMPILNKDVIGHAVMAGLSLNCTIANTSKMDRKNYFYPDLVKGYQITQFDKPLCQNGYLEVGEDKKRIGIKRIHIEEDTGKSTHLENGETLLDYNRSGVPLIEIVTEPHINSAEEAKEFLESLKDILKCIGISDVKMEEGSLRCDVNINVISKDESKISNIIELKNLNSFKSVVKGIEYEETRHRLLLLKGENTIRETRRWDESQNISIAMRTKHTEDEYRYFPELDIKDIVITEEEILKFKIGLPELPREKRDRWRASYNLRDSDINILTSQKWLIFLFEETLEYYNNPQSLSNWILSEVLRLIKKDDEDIGQINIEPRHLGNLLNLIDEGVVSTSGGKEIFKIMIANGQAPLDIAKARGLLQIDDVQIIEEVLIKVLSENTQSVDDYKMGKDRAFGYLVGQAMKAFKGRGNPQLINNILKKLLEEQTG